MNIRWKIKRYGKVKQAAQICHLSIYLSSIQLDWDSREPAEDENSSGRIKYRPDKEQQKVTFFSTEATLYFEIVECLFEHF